MSFRKFYKNICYPDRVGSSKNICKIDEDPIRNNQWWIKEDPYKIKDNVYHIPTIFNVGRNIFPAKDLNAENREETLNTYEIYAYEIMLEEYNIPVNRILSSKVIDIYAEPVPCYPLKVLIEVIVDVS